MRPPSVVPLEMKNKTMNILIKYSHVRLRPLFMAIYNGHFHFLLVSSSVSNSSASLMGANHDKSYPLSFLWRRFTFRCSCHVTVITTNKVEVNQ